MIPPVDWRTEDPWRCVMEQFDFQGTESNELGGDVYWRVHFGDLAESSDSDSPPRSRVPRNKIEANGSRSETQSPRCDGL